jgi:polyhydroxybutyrate depolymerase
MASTTGLNKEAQASRFMVAYPDGIGKSWNAGNCCGQAQSDGVDDVAFISKLIDKLTATYSADPARVFVTGFSNGAMMAYRLACELSERIAGIASVSGTAALAKCEPARPVSVWEMHGTSDSLVPYDGDPPYEATAALVQRWVTLNGCTAAPTLSTNGITKTSTWNGCRQGTTVRLDTVSGGHHTWFGSDLNPVPGEPGASELIARFFGSLGPRA